MQNMKRVARELGENLSEDELQVMIYLTHSLYGAGVY
jgi:hypothetical protein